MKIAYFTAHAPFGTDETFVLEEMMAVVETGTKILIIPRDPPKRLFHAKGKQLSQYSVWLPLINCSIVFSFLKALVTKPRLFVLLRTMGRNSRSLSIFIKNLAVTPKAVHVAALLKKENVEYIHVHWGSTTATMAWFASEITGIPWCMTLHRWDIAENNMLRLKVDKANFVRCIAEDGLKEVLRITGDNYKNKVYVLYMGVQFPQLHSSSPNKERTHFVVACPANFVEKKGHKYLIEAFDILRNKGIENFRCLVIGDGALENDIRKQISENNLDEFFSLTGRLPHEKLMEMYADNEIDAVVLPSITTSDNEREGIPVALMEAMSYGIPVISTDNGGISELLADSSGMMIKEKDSLALSEAIESLIKNKGLAKETALKGRQKINEDFNLHKNVDRLLKLMKEGL